jgi:DNA adenine methylase
METKIPRRQNDPLAKPFLKWAGGKRQLLPEIKRLLPKKLNNLQYYEPFVGAGALFLHLQPRRAVINDTNEDLMLTYKTIRDHIDELVEMLGSHKKKDNENYYYTVREQDREPASFHAFSGVARAARLIYLNKTCYNGLYRVNSQGMFNVPYGRYVNPAICDEPVLRAIHKYIHHDRASIDITCGDFANAVEKAGQGSFIYFDPPYHSPGNTNFTGYQAGGFNEDEQRRLRDVFAERTAAGAKCLLSNSDTPFIRELYNDSHFEIITVKAKRAINADSAGRGEVDELLIRNWNE